MYKTDEILLRESKERIKDMYVYIQSEKGLYTVGFYSPDGKWHAESDHDDPQKAAERTHYLNGGKSID